MYFFDDRKHHQPHIHAVYGEHAAAIDIEDSEILSGSLPKNKLRLVQAWIVIHRDDLMANWALAIRGEKLFNIDPLK